MAELSESQLLLLDNLIYLQEVANKDNKTVSIIVNDLLYDNKLNKSINPQKIGTEDEYPCKMTRKEWVVILEAIDKDPQLKALKIKNGQTGVMYDKKGQAITDSNGKVLEAGMRVATFVDPNKEATVVFRGTGGDFEWHDNGQGGYLSETDMQMAALEYIESLDYNNITVTGHSKGGNKTQYVAIMSDKVERAVSVDGQGFSKEFLEKYKDHIEANAHKITSISAEDDFVNSLLNPIAAHIKYIDTDEQENFAYNHKPNIMLDKNGQLRGPAEQGDISKYINEFTIHINDAVEEPYRSYAIDGVLAFLEKGGEGFVKKSDFQKYISAAILASHVDDFTFNKIKKEYGNGAELVVTFVSAVIFPYLFMDDFVNSAWTNIDNGIDIAMKKLKEFGDMIMVQLDAGAVKLNAVGHKASVALIKFGSDAKKKWDEIIVQATAIGRDIVNGTTEGLQAIDRFSLKLTIGVNDFFNSVADGTKKFIDSARSSLDKASDKAIEGVNNIFNEAKKDMIERYVSFKVGFKLLTEIPKEILGQIEKKDHPKARLIHNFAKGYRGYSSSMLTVDFTRMNDISTKLKDMEVHFEFTVRQMISDVRRVTSSVSGSYSESNVQRQIHNIQRSCDELNKQQARVMDELQRKISSLTNAKEHYKEIEEISIGLCSR
jgi:hypothetical protein